jgi:hypothetical protein
MLRARGIPGSILGPETEDFRDLSGNAAQIVAITPAFRALCSLLFTHHPVI